MASLPPTRLEALLMAWPCHILLRRLCCTHTQVHERAEAQAEESAHILLGMGAAGL